MLKQKIKEDTVSALKSGKKELAQTLRLLSAAILTKEKEKRHNISKENPQLKEEELVLKSQVTDEEVVSLLTVEVKKRRDAITLYEKGGRLELADKEKEEISVIQKYLPEQISEDKLIEMVDSAIKELGAKEIRDIGKVMQVLNPLVKGRADTSEVAKMVKERLMC